MNKSTLITVGISIGSFAVGLFCGEKSIVNRIRKFYRNDALEEAIDAASKGLFQLDEIVKGINHPHLRAEHTEKYDEILAAYIEYVADFEALQTRVEFFKISATEAIDEFDSIAYDLNIILEDLYEYLTDIDVEEDERMAAETEKGAAESSEAKEEKKED